MQAAGEKKGIPPVSSRRKGGAPRISYTNKSGTFVTARNSEQKVFYRSCNRSGAGRGEGYASGGKNRVSRKEREEIS